MDQRSGDEESQKLLVDMNHTEIFEFCEVSAKKKS